MANKRNMDRVPRERKLVNAMINAGGRCLSEVPAPKEFPNEFRLEFWSMPTPKPGRLVVVQFWENGGWDAYVPIKSGQIDEAIDEVINGNVAAGGGL